MPKKKKDSETSQRFGERMAQLCKAAGFSQRALAAQTGISQRMIAYYEKHADYSPTHFTNIGSSTGRKFRSDARLNTDRG